MPEVAPLVGAWIEIFRMAWKYRYADVAPLVGAWIEMKNGRECEQRR